jgi:hypothetical protein
MRQGDFEGAWAISGAVLASRDPASRDDPRLPYHQRWVWDGRPFTGRHVLVRCYHGLGDTLQFARFLPGLRQVAASVTLECQPSLVPLLRSIGGVDRYVGFDAAAPLPQGECDLEIMELAFALRARPDAVSVPYLHVTHAAPLPSGTTALCWQGGGWDRERDVPPELFAGLAAMPCVSLVPGPAPFACLNPDGSPQAVADTAALVAGAARIVTVDTMVAHLAGALGRPVSLLLKHEADWRWAAGSSALPWYPTVRLYRQPTPGDWRSVLAEVAADLAAHG